MILYKTKAKKISGSTKYREVMKKARRIFHEIEKKSRRNAYIRSAYFKKEKVFLALFWEHLAQKPERERRLRLRFFPCAYDLIEHTRHTPVLTKNPNNGSEMMYRFGGITQERELFYVQIKENVKTKRKDFMSIFPEIWLKD